MINKIKFTNLYSVRIEEERVVLFSGALRKIHYFPLNTYKLLVDISEQNLQQVIRSFDNGEQKMVEEELNNLIKKLEKDRIIEIVE